MGRVQEHRTCNVDQRIAGRLQFSKRKHERTPSSFPKKTDNETGSDKTLPKFGKIGKQYGFNEASRGKHGEYRQFPNRLGKIRSIQQNPGKKQCELPLEKAIPQRNPEGTSKNKDLALTTNTLLHIFSPPTFVVGLDFADPL